MCKYNILNCNHFKFIYDCIKSCIIGIANIFHKKSTLLYAHLKENKNVFISLVFICKFYTYNIYELYLLLLSTTIYVKITTKKLL